MSQRNKNDNNNQFMIILLSLFFAFFIYFVTVNALFPDKPSIFNNEYLHLDIKNPFRNMLSSDNIDVSYVYNEPLKKEKFAAFNYSSILDLKDISSKKENGSPTEEEYKEENNSAEVHEVIPMGITIGVRISTDGIMVLGTGYVNGKDGVAHKPSEGILQAGDLILSVNGKELHTKEELVNEIESEMEEIYLKIKREEEIIELNVRPIEAVEDGKQKIGVWVRDSTQGIGTITYLDPNTGKFAALGHGILDVDTRKLMTVRYGDVMKTEIKSVKKGKKGLPGELLGDIKTDAVIGQVRLNNEYGLYGKLDNPNSWSSLGSPVKIGLQNEVEEGPAVIISNVDGITAKEYDIYIESINKNSQDDSKGMVIRITDEELLEKTNGIVQGMSGSPIIQNNKLVGAVTHVFVQDPSKGYGIFIEKMLQQEKGM